VNKTARTVALGLYAVIAVVSFFWGMHMAYLMDDGPETVEQVGMNMELGREAYVYALVIAAVLIVASMFWLKSHYNEQRELGPIRGRFGAAMPWTILTGSVITLGASLGYLSLIIPWLNAR